MKLLIEENQYEVADVADVLDGLFTLQDIEQRISVSYVGYFYNPKVKDVVFILPKVLIDEQGKVFGKYEPKGLINLEESEIDERERKFLYEFAVWIHRAIVVYNQSHEKNDIVLHRNIESAGRGGVKKTSNTLLDIILALIRFNRENRQFFIFVLKNIHSGFNKINWGKTIARTTAIVQDESPTYLRPVNKKRQVNFDEELLVIFFSILQYVSDTYGFRSEINFGFKLITGAKFRRYLDGFGRTRLRKIKYKYFSDTAVRLWELCYAFFNKAYKIKMAISSEEYLLVKSFHIVFEAMIDELIGDKDIPAGLKEQDDGKLIDHFYTYPGLLINDRPDDDIYYIGDSKYYKLSNEPGKESIYKQYTYVRNVIQWNLKLFAPAHPNETEEQKQKRIADKGKFGQIKLRDDVTEGYNVIPNFFISARIDNELSYQDKTEPHPTQPPISRHFNNRLYDRDTLLLSHYDVNFLFVLALYARNNAASKAAWRDSVREKFREAVQNMLSYNFDFYALQAHPDVDARTYFKTHFQDTLGKTFRPYENQEIFSLALDKSYPEENKRLKASLSENFYLVQVKLGNDPSGSLDIERTAKSSVSSPDGMGNFLFGIINKYHNGAGDKKEITAEYTAFSNREATLFTMRNMPSGDISKAAYFIPMLDGGIAGYYKILGLTFGKRQQDVKDKDGTTIRIEMPCLNIRLGEFTPLGSHTAVLGDVRKWNGQIHTFAEVTQLYTSQNNETI